MNALFPRFALPIFLVRFTSGRPGKGRSEPLDIGRTVAWFSCRSTLVSHVHLEGFGAVEQGLLRPQKAVPTLRRSNFTRQAWCALWEGRVVANVDANGSYATACRSTSKRRGRQDPAMTSRWPPTLWDFEIAKRTLARDTADQRPRPRPNMPQTASARHFTRLLQTGLVLKLLPADQAALRAAHAGATAFDHSERRLASVGSSRPRDAAGR
jgi:hypothetical protein